MNFEIISTPRPIIEHSPEWYAWRKKGIGGSDAGAVMGLSRYGDPYSVWLSKTQDVSRPSNESMTMGRFREPYLVQEYANRTGNTILQPGGLIHADYDYIRVNLDGLVLNDRIIEAKTTRWPSGWGESDEDVPISYYIQCQHGMMVAASLGLIPTNAPICDLFVSIGGAPIKIYTIKGDPELWNIMIDTYIRFWNYVLSRTVPPENFT